jgi:hypothetical protein
MTTQETVDSKRERAANLVRELGGTAALMSTERRGGQVGQQGAAEYRVLSDRIRVIRYTQ